MPLFGRLKKSVDTTADSKAALERLHESVVTLERRESYIESKATTETDRAKAAVAQGDRRTALQCLKRKKVYDAQVDKMCQTRFSLEQQVMALEHSHMSVAAMKAMKQGSDSMRSVQKGVGLDDVDVTLDEIQETMEIANEIADAISRPIDGGMAFDDDDDLLAELEGFEQLDTDERVLSIDADDGGTVALASDPVPTPVAEVVQLNDVPPPAVDLEPNLVATTEEDDEFAALADSMNV